MTILFAAVQRLGHLMKANLSLDISLVHNCYRVAIPVFYCELRSAIVICERPVLECKHLLYII